MNNEAFRDAPRALKSTIQVDELLPHGKFFTYEDMPDKVIRWEGYAAEILHELPYVQRHLNDFEHIFGIPTVHTQFVLTGEEQSFDLEHNDYKLIMVNDRIADAIPASEALELDHDPSLTREFDTLSCRLLRHLRQVFEEGGTIMGEYCRYSQYVFSPSAPESKRLILVDVDPIYMRVLEKPENRTAGSVPIELLSILADCAFDVISLEKRAGHLSEAHGEILSLVEAISAEGHESVERVKLAITEALRQSDDSILDFIRKGEDSILALFEDVLQSDMFVRELLRRQIS